MIQTSSSAIEEIHRTSDELNILQSQERYAEIETRITKYLVDVGWRLVNNDSNQYIENIYLTNAKRWSKISEFPDPLLFALVKIKILMREKCSTDATSEFITAISRVPRDMHISHIQRELMDILDLGIKYRKGSVIDNLREFVDFSSYCQSRLGLTVKHNIRCNKLFALL